MDLESFYATIVHHKESSTNRIEYIMEQIHYLISYLSIESECCHEINDTLLLQLSIVHQLFTLNHFTSRDYHTVLLESNLLHSLVKLVNNGCPFVSYAARKACSSVLINFHIPFKAFEECLSLVLGNLIRNDSQYKHGTINYLQLIIDVLKTTRKEVVNSKMPTRKTHYHKLHFILTSVTSQWHIITDNIMSSLLTINNQEGTINNQKERTINQKLLHLLLLGCEILKHEKTYFNEGYTLGHDCHGESEREDVSPSYPMSFLYGILTTLDSILVASQLCDDDVICLTRVIDIYTKCIKLTNTDTQIELVSKINSHFYCSATSSSLSMIAIERWFHCEGYKILALHCNTIIMDYRIKSMEDSSVCTFARKLWSLSLYIATLEVPSGLNAVSIILDQLRSIVHQYDPSVNDLLMTQLILHLVSEHDDCLIGTLTNALHITMMESVSVKELHIDQLVIEFLYSISFDHTTVIDFLIENGTHFDSFLNTYLHYLTKNRMESLLYYCRKKDREYLEEVTVWDNLTPSEGNRLVDYSDSDNESDITDINSCDTHISTYSKTIDLFTCVQTLLDKMITREGGSLSQSKLTLLKSTIDSINHLLSQQ